MKLLLTSAGVSNQSIVNALAGLTEKPFAELNLAFVPTAATVESGDKTHWFIRDLVRLKNLEFKSIDIVDISAVSKDIWLPRLQDADILYVEGGNTAHLMRWMKKSGLQELLPEMLKTKIYVGVSAGSMVVCNDLALNVHKYLYNETMEEPQKNDGMKFVDFSILPHFNASEYPNLNINNLEKIKQKIRGAFYLIDDDTAITIDDDVIEVVSEGAWKLLK